MVLNKTSADRLTGVHPDLIKVVLRAAAICDQPFVVFEGLRTVEREKSLIAKGVSKLTNPFNCRHVPTNGYGHAVDLVPLKNGQPVWEWPLIYPIARAMKAAASELHIQITWGGDWKWKDGAHYELPKSLYP